MSKSLEAFDKIIEVCNYYHHHIVKDTEVQTIYGYPIDNIRKDLEVLEIIKKKKPHFGTIELGNYELYDLSIGGLTKEEFNKIKEWLEND